MLIKFFKNGQGSGAGPVGYLIAREVVAYSENRDVLRDDMGRIVMIARDPLPEIIRGNAALVEAEIDACRHQWTYRSGVLSFTREDAPTERQQAEVMDAFERLAFAGLERDQWDILWVRHTHEERVELHFVTPRMELSSGRSLNIAPPGYQKAFDALRDVENKRHGWSDPEDPARARDVVSLVELARRGQAREVIHDWLLDRITDGTVQDRPSMINALADAGFQIPRAGKDYITALDTETNERLRLRGDIFREDWTRTEAVERAIEGPSERDRNGEPSVRSEGQRLARLDPDELQGRLRAFEQKRAEYNRNRYGKPRTREPQSHQRDDRNDARGPELDPSDDPHRTLVNHIHADAADRHQLHTELVLGTGNDQQRREERPPESRDHEISDVVRRDTARRSNQADPHDMQDSRSNGRLPDADNRTLGQSLQSQQSITPESPKYGQSRPDARAVDWTGERIARLRRAVDDGLRSLGGAVHRLGATLDRSDDRATERIGRMLRLATAVSDQLGRHLRQFGRSLEWPRELGPGSNRDGRGFERGPTGSDVARDIGSTRSAAPQATRPTHTLNSSADRSR